MTGGHQSVRLRRCGAWLPVAKEPCARAAGHADSHRSRYALDNAYRAAVGREPPSRLRTMNEVVGSVPCDL